MSDNTDNNVEEENSIEKPGKKLSSYRNISYSKRDIVFHRMIISLSKMGWTDIYMNLFNPKFNLKFSK